MVIVGLDVSIKKTGIAIVTDDGISTQLIRPKGSNHGQKLSDIHRQLVDIVSHYKPDIVVIEEALITRFVDVVRAITYCHGAVLMALAAAGVECPIMTVHPTSLKKYVTGSGKASKQEMQDAIHNVTGLQLSNDEADAAGLALIGRAIYEKNIIPTCINKINKISKIRSKELDENIYKEFGLTTELVEEKRKERARESRKKYKEKRKKNA